MALNPGAVVLASAQRSGNTLALVLDGFGSYGNAVFLYDSAAVGVSGVSVGGFPGSAYGYVAVVGISEGGVGSQTLASLADVNISGLFDQQVLTYEGALGKWENAAPTGGGGGGGGPSDEYVYVQSTPSTTWNIVHNLNGYPTILVMPSGGGAPIIGSSSYASQSSLSVTFSTSKAGSAFLVLRPDHIIVYTQSVPSTAWSFTHNLNGYPIPTLLNGVGNTIVGSASYPSLSQINITFSAAVSGTAQLII